MKTILAWHFVGDTLRNGQPVPKDGVWLYYDGPLPLIMCERGLHASEHPLDALRYATGPILCRVKIGGAIVRIASHKDKLVATRRLILRRMDTTTLCRIFARRCAIDVIDKWNAPPVVRQYLETGDESLRAAARAAAWAAARAATRDAAWAAARAAARSAAGAAEEHAQTQHLLSKLGISDEA
ncbi:MAG: hypothetical protein ABFD60_07730 [Bryobacteraceae bacterium]